MVHTYATHCIEKEKTQSSSKFPYADGDEPEDDDCVCLMWIEWMHEYTCVKKTLEFDYKARYTHTHTCLCEIEVNTSSLLKLSTCFIISCQLSLNSLLYT